MAHSFKLQIYSSSNRENTVEVEASYKVLESYQSLHKWQLKLNGYNVINSRRKDDYVQFWDHFINMCLEPDRVNRILIVGGGNQILSNHLVKNYPCNITLLDPNCFLYLDSNMKQILKTKSYVNTKHKDTNLQQKMTPLDMTLEEALEDGILELNSFDLILVDPDKDTYEIKTGIFDVSKPQLYYDLLKDKAHLIVNNNYPLKKITKEMRDTLDHRILEDYKADIQYYYNYMNAINSLLCETDHVFKLNTKLSMYSKVLPEVLELEEYV